MKNPKIYLHWSATPYDWKQPGHYHTIVTGDGTVHKLHSYDDNLSAHTYNRNYNSISLAIACMGGNNYWKEYPPTEKQIEALCREAALVAKKFRYTVEDITVKNIMTHAEAAANRDYPIEKAKLVSGWRLPASKTMEIEYLKKAESYGLPHENYGPSSWHDGWPGGFVDRWDLWQLKSTDKGGVGGFLLRKKIKQYMEMEEVGKSQIVPESQRVKVKAYLKKYCEEYNLSYHDILAQAIIESNLTSDAISSSRALGVGQIKLATAEYICKRHNLPVPQKEEELFDIDLNCKLMCLIMSDMLKKAQEKHLYDTARLLYHDGEFSLEQGVNGLAGIEYNNKVVKKKIKIKEFT